MTAPAQLGGLLPRCSRRVSAGITPAPGTTSRLPVWWGPTDWVEVDVRGALTEAVCREHHVAHDTVLSVARAMARFADRATGRGCRPTNERLVEAAQCSLSTVQRARRLLKALGLVVEVTAGRSNMTRDERLEAWERGSSHRAVAAEFVLCSRRERTRRPQPDLRVVERDTPPVGQVVRGEVTSRRTPLRDQEPKRGGRSAPALTEKGRRRPAPVADLRPRRLAVAVKAGLEWLRDVETGRLVPALTKFAQEDWSGDDVALAIRNVIAARGHRGVPAKLRMPAAYLAKLLREVDPADRPTVHERWVRDTERAEASRRLRAATTTELCGHGQPGGHLRSPSGWMACPLCRKGSC